MSFVKGTDIQEHVKLLWIWKAVVENLSTSAMTDETWRGIIIRSIPPTTKWLPVIRSLYSMTSSADIISTLLTHGMILDKGNLNKPALRLSNTVLVAQTGNPPCTNPGCKVKKWSTHTTENCYWPGGGKEGQFPPNFGQRTRANAAGAAALPHGDHDHFVLSARIKDTPGISGVILEEEEIYEDGDIACISKGFQSFKGGKIPTFMDSGVSDDKAARGLRV
jgi:hypothetical protein